MTDLEPALAALAEPAPAALAPRVAAELGLTDVCFVVDSPAGRLRVAMNRRSGISLLDLDTGEDAFRRSFAARYPSRRLAPTPVPAPDPALATPAPTPAPANPPTRLVDALSGRVPATALHYDLSSCSPFQRAVLAKAAEIPRGEVRSYGWIAREIGHEGATRAVGTALGRNPIPVLIPCHRVVRTDGQIGNYALGTAMKHDLLRNEGVDLDDLQRLAAAGHRYVGSATTHIFCVPTCRHARRIQAPNRTLFRKASDAATRGYRPCQTCRPTRAEGPMSTT